MTETVRVRFAPSPTGHLHIGGARTAIYNWAFARHHGGVFVLRIDDTDPERSTEENTAAILRALRWLGLEWDEGPEAGGDAGPYYQTQRTEIYERALESLRESGAAYPCFCSAQELASKRDALRTQDGYAGYDRTCRGLSEQASKVRVAAGEAHVWRVKVPEARGEVVFEDAIRGTITFSADSLDDYIIARSDGSPTYNFATVVDDAEMGITHVIRGDDHLSNTPRQIVVFEALGKAAPVYAHMSLIFGSDGKRLSKRHGATSVEAYREGGYLPETLVNYLALLGWSFEERDIFSRDELVQGFDLSRVSRNPVVFDPEKLEWMNGVYIRALQPHALVARMTPLLVEAGFLSSEEAVVRERWLEGLAVLVSERIKRLDEVVPMVRFLFEDSVVIAEDARAKALTQDGVDTALDAVIMALGSVGEFDAPQIEGAMRSVPEQLMMKPKVVFQAARVAVSGSTVSLPLFESMALLGKESTLRRLRDARSSLA